MHNGHSNGPAITPYVGMALASLMHEEQEVLEALQKLQEPAARRWGEAEASYPGGWGGE